MTVQASDHSIAAGVPSFAEAIGAWAKIGFLSFGGPAGQIALMHRVVVDEKKWLDERQFLSALNFCMLLPGPEAMQLATYVGWRLHGIVGGVAAGLLFVVPGALVVLGLSAIYAAFGNVPLVAAMFVGVKAAVLAIVIQALLKVSRRALGGRQDWMIAGGAFVAIFMFKVPFPIIILAAAFVGFMTSRTAPSETARSSACKPVASQAVRTTLVTVATWLAIWLVPLLVLAWALGPDHVLMKVGWFFSKLAVVTFGGAYAVLAYMAQQAVTGYGWLTPGEMLDGLGLAETTPGPLILVTEFVGFMAGFRASGGGWMMAMAAAAVTLWATFAPCFLWIFAGAPYVERLNNEPRLKAALGAVTAAVVGVILNLSVWFGLNVIFTQAARVTWGPLDLQLPTLATVDPIAATLALCAAGLMFIWRCGVLMTLSICTGLAMLWHGIPYFSGG